MKKVSADLIVTNTGNPIKNGVIIYDPKTGIIQDILTEVEGLSDVQKFAGIIVPGYINAHCHLELSHLKGVIPTGTGLIPFIKRVVGLRDFPQEQIDEQIKRADEEMIEDGIVAVGDISNKSDTANIKKTSLIQYYTFVEMFDFLQDDAADATFEQYREVYNLHDSSVKNRKSMVPHASYSVSTKLFEHVNNFNEVGSTISIHNQELKAENELFVNKSGEFLDFYKDFGIPINHFKPIGKSAIHYTLRQLRPDFKTLMVHNTQSSIEDILAAQKWNDQIFWVTCPNANLYIENKLPRYKDFLACDATICIGTDSLSANWHLSIFQEMKTIKKYQADLNDLDIIKWATINGARALGFNKLGKLSEGLAPGLNWIEVEVNNGRFDLSQAKSTKRLA